MLGVEQAAAEVLDQRDAQLAAQLGQLEQPRSLREAVDPEVAPVHAQDQRGLGVKRLTVVGQARAVGGSNLLEPRTALAQHLRDPERATDLHQLAAAHEYVSALGQRVDGEQHGGRVVVDDHGGFGSYDLPESRLGVHLAVSALAGHEIELEVRVGRGHERDAPCRLGRQGGAAEIGVDQDPGGVDERAEGR